MSPRLRQQPGMPRRLQPAISGLLAVALLSALPAAGGEARSLLKLPTPAGHYAADPDGCGFGHVTGGRRFIAGRRTENRFPFRLDMARRAGPR
jgi:hypothetical protein